jgi:hypothetical protein
MKKILFLLLMLSLKISGQTTYNVPSTSTPCAYKILLAKGDTLKTTDTQETYVWNGASWIKKQFSGNWTDIKGRPSLLQGVKGDQGIQGIQGLTGASGTTDYNALINKPTIPTNTNQLTNGNGFITSYTETDPIVKAISGLIKSNGITISSAIAGTDYLTPTGSAASLISFPTLNQNTTGTASNLSGTPALPNGTTTTTQAISDNTTKIATDAFCRTFFQPMNSTTTALTAGTTVTWTPILGTNTYTITPAQAETINMGTIPAACVGSDIDLIITTSGTSAFVITFGTNTKSQATLSTGTVTGKIFIIRFKIFSTTAVYEVSRTTTM